MSNFQLNFSISHLVSKLEDTYIFTQNIDYFKFLQDDHLI